jgi:uncharacterized membrane protein SpoIIM required for sporulation
MTIWVAVSPGVRAGVLPAYVRDAIRDASGGRGDIGIPPAGLSTFILVNNIQVAFLAFALGITFGIGTVYLVVQNAVLIGLLAGAYTSVGKAGVFWALVLPHGLLELTAIAIAAGAGLRMGWSLIDPGERRRSMAVAEEARDAAMVVLGVLPAFGVAAVVEGFLTGTSVPDPVEIGIGAGLAVLYVAVLFAPARGSKAAGRLDAEVLVGETPGEGPRWVVHDQGPHAGQAGGHTVPS